MQRPRTNSFTLLSQAKGELASQISPIIRLDSPLSGSSVLGKEIHLRGWMFLTEAAAKFVRSNQEALSVLCEEAKEQQTVLFAGLTCAADIASDSSRRAQLKELQISDIGRSVPGESDRFQALAYHLQAVLDVSHFIPADGAPPRMLAIRLMLRTERQVCISNPLHMGIQPQTQWDKALGGFLFPTNGQLCSEILMLSGWAIRRGDEVKRIQLHSQRHRNVMLASNLPSPRAAAGLPDLKGADCCGFGTVLTRKQAEEQQILFGEALQHLSPEVEVHFQSGERIDFKAPALRWFPWRGQGGKAPLLLGRIETFREVDDSLLSLEGWLASYGFERPQMFLEARKWRLELKDGETIFWHPRSDISQSYPLQAGVRPEGFVLRIPPQALDAAPGIVKLVAELPLQAARLELGPGSFCRLLSRQIFARRPKTASATIRAGVSLALTAAGVRTSFPLAKPTSSVPRSEDFPARVLFVSANLSATEGAPKVLFRVIQGLLRSGLEAKNCLLVSTFDGELRAEYEKLGIPVIVAPELGVFSLTWEGYFTALGRMQRELEAFEPQLVFANVIDSFWAVDWAFRNQLPAVWAIHESLTPETIHPELDARLRLILLDRLAFACRKIFVAERTKALYSSIDDGTSVVIANSIDASEIRRRCSEISKQAARANLGVNGANVVVSIIGTTTHRKGQDVFLREVAMLVAERPEQTFSFFVVGAREGAFLTKLREQAKDLGIAKQVTFVPETRDVAEFFIASDVVVIASREESAPLVSLEAFAYGVPLVSTDVFGLAEQLQDGQNALTFSIERLGHLKTQIGRLLDDAQLRSTVVAGGEATLSEQASFEAQTERYRDFIGAAFRFLDV